jgi:ribulose kinase
MRGQFSDEMVREFIKLLGGFSATGAGIDGMDLGGIMRVAG